MQIPDDEFSSVEEENQDEERPEFENDLREEEDDAVYKLEDVPPFGLTILNAVQHLLLCFPGAIMLPLLIFSELCFDDSPDVNYEKSKIITSFFFLAGVGTFLQVVLGIRLPVSQVASIAYFTPIISLMRGDRWKCPARILDVTNHNITLTSNTSYVYLDNDGSYVDSNELWQKRMREIQGGITIAGLMQMVIGGSGVIGLSLRYVGPLTLAPSLVIVSISLLNASLRFSSVHWGISMCVVGIVLLFQYLARFQLPFPQCSVKKRKCSSSKRPIFAMFPFFFALLSGWLLAYILTVTNSLPADPTLKAFRARTDLMSDATKDSPWFAFPYPFRWGLPTFSISTVIVLFAAMVVGIVDTIIDSYATAQIVQHTNIPTHAVNRGIAVEGFNILLHGMIGTGNAPTTFADTVVGLGLSKFYSRRVLVVMSIIFIFFGLFTKFGAIFVAIPQPVIGGQMIIISGLIFSVAISTAANADLNNMRNMFVFGFSTFIALIFEKWTATNPVELDTGSAASTEVVKAILGTGMLVAPIVACILDNTLPGSLESRGIIKWQHKGLGRGDFKSNDPVYDLPFKTGWDWTRRVPFCPRFGEKTKDEDVEIVENPSTRISAL